MKVKSIEVEALVAMFVIAMGKSFGDRYKYVPKIPNVFSTNININGFVGNFSHLRVDSDGLTFGFTKKEIYTTLMKDDTERRFSIEEVKRFAPCLLVSIITHVCDMIENYED